MANDLFKSFLENPAPLINAKFASSLYEPLALRFLNFFIRCTSCFFLSAASFGLSSHPISPLTSCLIGETFADDTANGTFGAFNVAAA